MKPVDLTAKLGLVSETWAPKIVAQMGDVQFKLAKLHGEFVWHAHPEADEAFLVLAGTLRIETRAGDLTLEQGQMVVVPRGVEHRPVADTECHVMLIEPVGVVNTGDAETDRTAPGDVWI